MLNTEPVLILSLARALLLLGAAFGLEWTREQVAAFMIVMELTLAIVTRAKVTSESSLAKLVDRLEHKP